MKKIILILVLFISVSSFGQSKSTLANLIDLKKSSLENFISSYNNDSHIYDDNLKHLNEIYVKKVEISKLETQKKLIGIKKSSTDYKIITEIGKNSLEKIKIDLDKEIEILRVKNIESDLEMYNLNHPSLLK